MISKIRPISDINILATFDLLYIPASILFIFLNNLKIAFNDIFHRILLTFHHGDFSTVVLISEKVGDQHLNSTKSNLGE